MHVKVTSLSVETNVLLASMPTETCGLLAALAARRHKTQLEHVGCSLHHCCHAANFILSAMHAGSLPQGRVRGTRGWTCSGPTHVG